MRPIKPKIYSALDFVHIYHTSEYEYAGLKTAT